MIILLAKLETSLRPSNTGHNHMYWRALNFAGTMIGFLCIFLMSGVLCSQDTSKNPGESQLIKSLMGSYDKLASPTNGRSPVTISCSLTPFQLLGIDDKKQEITISGGFLMMWLDQRLSWNVSSYGNIFMVPIAADSIWRPDIGLTSGTENTFDFSAIPNNRLSISTSGLVSWNLVRVFKSTCQLNMENFPFDEQNCTMKFSSQTSLSSSIDMVPNEVAMTKEYYTENNEWHLEHMELEKASYDVPKAFLSRSAGLKMKFAGLKIHVILKRQQGYYWIHLIIPCMLLSILVNAVFLMPSSAGEKISFSVTILLAFTVYQLLIAGEIPKASFAQTPMLSIYLSVLIGLSAASVLASILNLCIHHTDPKIKMPTCLHSFIFKFLAMIITCNQRKSAVPKDTTTAADKSNPELRISDLGEQKLPKETSQNELVAIRELLSSIDNKNSRDESEPVSEWKLASAIVDRFFLIFFSGITVVVTVALLVTPQIRTA